ncbi:MAG: inorganic diphosphatase [bacterium]|nr:inorganic diphosphatase [bacterium]
MSYPFNKINFGEDGKSVTTVIEIPKGSMLKAEWDRKKEYFVLDRVEPGIFAKPCNYGFIPQTLDEDGDELDTLVVTAEGLQMGLVVEEAIVIGMVDFEDDGENDHKIVVVSADDRHYGEIKNLDDLGEAWKKQIEHHFNHYKDLKKPGSTKVRGFENADKAWEIIRECAQRAQENKWW